MIPKFRAYNKNLKRMEFVVCMDFSRNVITVTMGNTETSLWCLEACELMQSTGRKDINGTEIYAGDIIKSDVENAACFLIYWCEKFCSFFARKVGYEGDDQIGLIHMFTSEKRVVGNIHQNSELWK